MPIYEYKCADCGTHLEKRQSVSDEPLKVCESCGGRLEKQWSLSGFQFKGAGWYVTDYSSKSSGDKAAPASDASKNGSSESTSSAETASKSKSSETKAEKPASGTT